MQVECRPLSNYPVPETRNRREAERFHQVQTARKVLTAHHGVSL